MEGIFGAIGRLMTQTWALSPYGVLAGKLMFGNKLDRRKPFADSGHARLLWTLQRRTALGREQNP